MERLGRIVGWALVPLYVAGATTAALLQVRLGGVSMDADGLGLVTAFGAYAIVGAILVRARPRNAVGWVLVAVSLALGVFPALSSVSEWAVLDRYEAVVPFVPQGPLPWWATIGVWLNAWYWLPVLGGVLIVLPLVFPDGRLPSRRWRPLAWIVAVDLIAFVALGMTRESLDCQEIACLVPNPMGIAGNLGAEGHPLAGPLFTVFTACFVAAAVSVVVRFRRSRGIERQQLKWFLAATVLIPTLPLSEQAGVLGDVVFLIVIAGLPTAIGIAVLRYRLYEIDRIVNRTLVYAVVTALLAGTYGVIVLGVPRLVGPDEPSDLLVAGATLVAAALFRPLRRRVQDLVDRRFSRSKFDAHRTVAAFAARLRDEVELGHLAADLQGTVTTTLHPRHVSLWVPEEVS